MFVSPFLFLAVLTNGLVTHSGLIYDFNNDGPNAAQQLQICPVFMVHLNHLNRLENRRVFSSADLSKVLIIVNSVTRNISPKQNFSYNQIHLNAVSCSNLPYNKCWPILALPLSHESKTGRGERDQYLTSKSNSWKSLRRC